MLPNGHVILRRQIATVCKVPVSRRANLHSTTSNRFLTKNSSINLAAIGRSIASLTRSTSLGRLDLGALKASYPKGESNPFPNGTCFVVRLSLKL
jgi:hypothetical protein